MQHRLKLHHFSSHHELLLGNVVVVVLGRTAVKKRLCYETSLRTSLPRSMGPWSWASKVWRHPASHLMLV